LDMTARPPSMPGLTSALMKLGARIKLDDPKSSLQIAAEFRNENFWRESLPYMDEATFCKAAELYCHNCDANGLPLIRDMMAHALKNKWLGAAPFFAEYMISVSSFSDAFELLPLISSGQNKLACGIFVQACIDGNNDTIQKALKFISDPKFIESYEFPTATGDWIDIELSPMIALVIFKCSIRGIVEPELLKLGAERQNYVKVRVRDTGYTSSKNMPQNFLVEDYVRKMESTNPELRPVFGSDRVYPPTYD